MHYDVITERRAIMATTNVNIRMDVDLKKQFESFCADVGLNMSMAFNMFAKKTVRDKRIPFIVGTESYNLEAVNELLADLDNAKKEADTQGWISAGDLEKELGVND